jgi:hypothetical protein
MTERKWKGIQRTELKVNLGKIGAIVRRPGVIAVRPGRHHPDGAVRRRLQGELGHISSLADLAKGIGIYVSPTKEHGAGTGSVTVKVKLPTTMHVDGFPVPSFVISVTPSQPCAVSVGNKSRHVFDVTLSALDGGAIAAGSLDVLVVG